MRQTMVTVNNEVHVSTPKTKRGRRVVALDEMTVEVLRRHRDRFVRLPELVFVDNWGRLVHPSWVTARFRELAEGAGLPRIRLHDLRHTHATLALQAGIHRRSCPSAWATRPSR